MRTPPVPAFEHAERGISGAECGKHAERMCWRDTASLVLDPNRMATEAEHRLGCHAFTTPNSVFRVVCATARCGERGGNVLWPR